MEIFHHQLGNESKAIEARIKSRGDVDVVGVKILEVKNMSIDTRVKGGLVNGRSVNSLAMMAHVDAVGARSLEKVFSILLIVLQQEKGPIIVSILGN